jgi:hypothetical protein
MPTQIQALKLALAFALTLATLLQAQQKPAKPQNLFPNSTDIGVTHKGATAFNRKTGDYTLTGGGADMWGSADAFHFDWAMLTGDATLTADIRFPLDPLVQIVPLEKAVLIFRESLDPGSAYADVAIHGDGHITLQWRAAAGGETKDTTSAQHGVQGFARLRIERKGNQFTISAGPSDDTLVASPPVAIALRDPVYVGIGVCAHDATGLAAVTFSNVRLDRK